MTSLAPRGTVAVRVAAAALMALSALIVLLPGVASAQEPAEKTAGTAIATRACPAAPSAAEARPKSKGKKRTLSSAPVPGTACIEAQFSPLDIQEFFQTFVREQSWKIGDERSADDGWTFYRFFEKDDLLRFVKIETQMMRVTWTEGRAFVQIGTLELNDGFTRVQVSTRFRGYGQNADRFAPPKAWWTLDSNGVLEGSLIAALQAHFKSMQ